MPVLSFFVNSAAYLHKEKKFHPIKINSQTNLIFLQGAVELPQVLTLDPLV
jgi:hypothetical protein